MIGTCLISCVRICCSLTHTYRSAVATRLPITNDILLKIRPHMKLDTYDGKVMWAAFTFAHACLMRCGEFATRSYKDKKCLPLGAWTWENAAKHGTVTLPSSKTLKE